MAWFRWYEGTASDAKFRLIARKAGQPVAYVVAVWAMILERASEAGERGRISGFDCEAADAMLDMPEGAACAIVEAMQAKGMIDAERVSKWNERQPRREDDSAERVREYRARKKAESDAQCNAEKRAVTQCNDSVTQCNAAKRSVTLDKSREEENKNNIYLSSGARARVASSVPKEDMPDITFEQFADAYPPDKLDRDAAWIAWKAQHKAGKLPGLCDLFTSLEAWKASEQWQNDKGAYIPLASNFLGKSIYKRTPPANKARASPHRVSKAGEFNAERQAQIFNEVLADLEAEQHGNTENGQSAQAGSPICAGAQLRERVPEAAGFTLDASARAL